MDTLRLVARRCLHSRYYKDENGKQPPDRAWVIDESLDRNSGLEGSPLTHS